MLRVTGGVSTRVVDRAVASVFDDRHGGVVFEVWGSDRLEQYWLRAGSTEAEAIPGPGQRTATAASVSGSPTVLLIRDGSDLCPEVAAILRDLPTGRERVFTCELPLEDASLYPASHGGGIFVGTFDVSSGASGTSRRLVFWDMSGREIEPPHNPFPDSCEPCQIGAVLSPAGTRLAYYHRPDAKWPPDEWDAVPMEEWWEQSKRIPAQVTVIDLTSGTLLFRLEVEADAGSLADFDGRYVVIERADAGAFESTIIDITDAGDPIRVPGRVRLVPPRESNS